MYGQIDTKSPASNNLKLPERHTHAIDTRFPTEFAYLVLRLAGQKLVYKSGVEAHKVPRTGTGRLWDDMNPTLHTHIVIPDTGTAQAPSCKWGCCRLLLASWLWLQATGASLHAGQCKPQVPRQGTPEPAQHRLQGR